MLRMLTSPPIKYLSVYQIYVSYIIEIATIHTAADCVLDSYIVACYV